MSLLYGSLTESINKSKQMANRFTYVADAIAQPYPI
jgi:hypothetical protein